MNQTHTTSTTLLSSKIRLDTWLWAARFYKTRSWAQTAINGGKVRVNNNPCKPSKNINIGDTITYNNGWNKCTVIVLALANKRGCATVAKTLYQETSESIKCKEKNAMARKLAKQFIQQPADKPNKKARRLLKQLKSRIQ